MISRLGLLIQEPMSPEAVERRWTGSGGQPFEIRCGTVKEYDWVVLAPAPVADGLLTGRIILSHRQVSIPSMEDVTHELILDACLQLGNLQAREAFHQQLRQLWELRSASSCGWTDHARRQVDSLSLLEDLALAPCFPALDQTYALFVSTPTGRPDGAWLYTLGLERLGFPELEILQVPVDLLDLAPPLVEAMVDRWLTSGLPAPLTPVPITRPGPAWTWAPLPRVLPLLGNGVEGTNRDRANADPVAWRAVLLPWDEAGRLTRSSLDDTASILQELDEMPFAVNLSGPETDRQRLLALHHLPTFLAMVDEHRGAPGWDFRAKLEFEGEHLWFQVLRREHGDTVQARLCHPPLSDRGLQEGRTDTYNLRQRLSSWAIATPDGSFLTPELRHLPPA
jgi:hypothetical protein